MDQKWKIIYYETLEGKRPIFDFIQNLDVRIQSKISNVIDLLIEFGTQVGLPHAKKLTGTPLWELRIIGGDSVRIFYLAIETRSFLMLHAFKKKKQETDKREIKTAMRRLDEYKSRQNDVL